VLAFTAAERAGKTERETSNEVLMQHPKTAADLLWTGEFCPARKRSTRRSAPHASASIQAKEASCRSGNGSESSATALRGGCAF
jgi:hypothetical protein